MPKGLVWQTQTPGNMLAMAHRTFIGSDELQEAQEAAGYSNEAMGQRLHVSERTWRRWKESGWVPTPQFPTVVTLLKLDHAEAPGRFNDNDNDFSRDEISEIRDLLQGLQNLFDALQRRLDALQPPQD